MRLYRGPENLKKNGKLRERRIDGSGPPSKIYRTIINPKKKIYIPADAIGPAWSANKCAACRSGTQRAKRKDPPYQWAGGSARNDGSSTISRSKKPICWARWVKRLSSTTSPQCEHVHGTDPGARRSDALDCCSKSITKPS